MEGDQDNYILQFISQTFGKNVSIGKRLLSFEDTNVLVIDQESRAPYVFKIIKNGAMEDKGPVLMQQVECALHLRRCGFKTSKFVPGKNGSYLQVFHLEAGQPPIGESPSPLCLLYSYIAGVELENTGCVTDPAIMLDLGMLLGDFHLALKDCPHDHLMPDPEEPWCMRNVNLLARNEYLHVIRDQEKSEKLKTIIDEIDNTLSSYCDQMRKGIIHGDFHGYNIIVDETFSVKWRSTRVHSGPTTKSVAIDKDRTPENEKWTISTLATYLNTAHTNSHSHQLHEMYGVIDYGEVSYSYIVLEVGRLMADMMCIALSKHRLKQSSPELSADTKCVKSWRKQFDSMNNEHSSSENHSHNSGSASMNHEHSTSKDHSHNSGIAPMNHEHSSCENHSHNSGSASMNQEHCSSENHSHNSGSALINQAYISSENHSHNSGSTSMNQEHCSSEDSSQCLGRKGESCSRTMLRNSISLGGVVLCGYLRTNPLTDVELSVLKASVMTSLVQYYVLGVKAMQDQPENASYVGLATIEAEELLWEMESMSQDDLLQAWTDTAVRFLG